MVPVPADPAKTEAAQESLAAMRAKMKKDFEDQWARLTPDEQTAMRKQWKVIAPQPRTARGISRVAR
jgi:hypothetical protein